MYFHLLFHYSLHQRGINPELHHNNQASKQNIANSPLLHQ